MADQKLTQLTGATSAAELDELYLVTDTTTTPISKKISFDNLQNSFTDISLDSAQFDTSITGVTTEGQLAYNSNNATLEYGTAQGFPVEIGKTILVPRRVKNETGGTLTKGTVVYINGASGNDPTIAKALATSDTTSAFTIGLVGADIPNNQKGEVITYGYLKGLNLSAYAAGDTLYLSGTVAGEFTNVKPTAPIHYVKIGIVTRATVDGEMIVSILNGFELDEIHNVQLISPANNDVLQYEASTQLWKNKPVSFINGLLDHNTLTGLSTGDPHSQYLLLSGRSPNQQIDGLVSFTDTVSFKKGTISNPAFRFEKATSTEWEVGWYVDIPFPTVAPNSRTLNWSINGQSGGRFADSGLQMQSGGSSTTPSYTFQDETQSGMYLDTSTLRPSFTNYGTRSGAFAIGQFIAEDGIEASPSIGFYSDTTSGFYLANTNTGAIGITGQGSEIIRFGWTTALNVPRFSINTTSLNLAVLAANQSSNTAAIPSLYLNQVDLDQAFIDLRTTVAAGNPINTTTLGTYYGKFRVEVNGTAKWVGLYN